MRPALFLTALLFLNSCNVLYRSELQGVVYRFVDQMPKYPGASVALITDFRNKFHYPSNSSIVAFFNFEFIINERGRLIMPKVNHKDKSDLNKPEQEALRAIKKLKRWIPGSLNGTKVPVKISLNIRF